MTSKSAQKSAKRTKKQATTRKVAAKRTLARRSDFGAPIDAFFAKQPTELRELLEALRKLVEQAAPDAKASIKWGMPFYELHGVMMCALGAHKSHVNLILAGPPAAFADPKGLLDGAGKTGRHLKLRRINELPRQAVRGWLRTAVQIARASALRP